MGQCKGCITKNQVIENDTEEIDNLRNELSMARGTVAGCNSMLADTTYKLRKSEEVARAKSAELDEVKQSMYLVTMQVRTLQQALQQAGWNY
jgi:hypothetical protein